MRVVFGILSLAGLALSATHFTANGTLYCSLGATWCFQVSMWELDYFSPNDKIDFFGTRCTSRPVHEYELEGTENGDSMFSRFYEIVMYVRHNCTRNGKIREIERVHEYVPLRQKEFHASWNVSVFNRFEQVDNYA